MHPGLPHSLSTFAFQLQKKQSKGQTANYRHSLKREPPLPIYIGLNLHTQTISIIQFPTQDTTGIPREVCAYNSK